MSGCVPERDNAHVFSLRSQLLADQIERGRRGHGRIVAKPRSLYKRNAPWRQSCHVPSGSGQVGSLGAPVAGEQPLGIDADEFRYDFALVLELGPVLGQVLMSSTRTTHSRPGRVTFDPTAKGSHLPPVYLSRRARRLPEILSGASRQ